MYMYFLLFIAGFALAWAVKKRKVKSVFIDKGGVLKLPPTYIETAQRKTLNIKFNNGKKYTVPLLSLEDTIQYIPQIEIGIENFHHAIEAKDARKQLEAIIFLARILGAIATKTEVFFKRIKKQRDFYKSAIDDIAELLDACKKILDFWTEVKKKVRALHPTSNQAITGEEVLSNLLSKGGASTK